MAFISSRRGLTIMKKIAAKAPPPISRNRMTPRIINGAFDFFFAGAVAAGAAAGAAGTVAGGGTGAAGGGVVIGADG